MTLLGGDAGLRRGEIIALRWHDVDFASKQITISRSDWNGEETLPKGGRKRHVPMTKRLIAALEELKRSGCVGDRVIHDGKGRRVAANSLHVWMATVLRRAKRPVRRGLHVLRHTFCSHLAMRGAPAKVIQELAGHVTLTTTLGYMHLAKGAGHAAIALLDGGRNNEQWHRHSLETPRQWFHRVIPPELVRQWSPHNSHPFHRRVPIALDAGSPVEIYLLSPDSVAGETSDHGRRLARASERDGGHEHGDAQQPRLLRQRRADRPSDEGNRPQRVAIHAQQVHRVGGRERAELRGGRAQHHGGDRRGECGLARGGGGQDGVDEERVDILKRTDVNRTERIR